MACAAGCQISLLSSELRGEGARLRGQLVSHGVGSAVPELLEVLFELRPGLFEAVGQVSAAGVGHGGLRWQRRGWRLATTRA